MKILEFLDIKYQTTLMNKAQSSTDRFEHTLSFYKKIYVREFKEACMKTRNSDEKMGETEKVICAIKPSKLYDFFDVFENAYIKWINNETRRAMEDIQQCFRDKELFLEENIKNRMMFRARKSDNALSHWDMFHIPFNKRYLIKNQRYSLVGRPMLYLGFSPYLVLKEINLSEDEHAYLSSFYLKENENLKICDLRYNIPNDKDSNDFMYDYISYKDRDEEERKKFITKRFYISIVSSICAFKKRNFQHSDFCEEYVLPQILSEIIHEEKFDGLMYTSTTSRNIIVNNDIDQLFNSNVVIFTNYNQEKSEDKTYVYDKELYRKFSITTPKDVTFNYMVSEDEMKLIKKEFNNIEHQNKKDEKMLPLIYQEITGINRYDRVKEAKENKDAKNENEKNENNKAELEKQIMSVIDFDYSIKTSILYEILVDNTFDGGVDKDGQ